MFDTGNKYRRVITQTLPVGAPVGTSIVIDVYDVIDCFDIRDPGLQHALKKLLCTGIRGHKNATADIRESFDALERVLHRLAVNGAHDASVESGSGSARVKVGPSTYAPLAVVMESGNSGTGRQSKARGAKTKKAATRDRSRVASTHQKQVRAPRAGSGRTKNS